MIDIESCAEPIIMSKDLIPKVPQKITDTREEGKKYSLFIESNKFHHRNHYIFILPILKGSAKKKETLACRKIIVI